MGVAKTTIPIFLISASICIIGCSAGNAWEGSVQKDAPARLIEGLKTRFSGSAPAPAPFIPRTITYPASEGASLGQGWDFVLNKKVNSTCIEFVPDYDEHQNADMNLQQVTDDETLDVALNTMFSSSAKGSYAGISAGGQVDITGRVRHRFTSKDIVFVAQVSIGDGAIYVSPHAINKKRENAPEKGDKEHILGAEDKDAYLRVKLFKEADKLAKKAVEFRAACGDGYIASIGLGADLYLLFHFHDTDDKTRIELETFVKASGGVGDLFSGEASARFQAIVETESKKGNLTIRLLQEGGIIGPSSEGGLPIDLAGVKKKVQALATEAHKGPRPVFMTVVPYSDLPAFPGSILPNLGDELQRAIRYHKRLLGVHSELIHILDDFRRDRDADGAKKEDSYYFWYRHFVRKEDFLAIGAEVRSEIRKIAGVITILAGPGCSPKKESEKIESTCKDELDKFLKQQCEKEQGKEKCKEARYENMNLDDLRFWILLPMPSNVIPATVKKEIEAPNTKQEQRGYRYGQYLFRHWVDRLARVRCILFIECLSKDEELMYHRLILGTFDFPHDKSIEEVVTADTNANTRVLKIDGNTGIQIESSRDDARLSQFDVYHKSKDSDKWGEPIVSKVKAGDPVRHEKLKSAKDGFWIMIKGMYCGGFGCLGGGAPMVNSRVIRTGPLAAEVWFFDPGEVQARNHDLSVKLKATPQD